MTATLDGIASLLRTRAVDEAVRRVAPDLGADPDLIMDSRTLERATRDLDPASPSFVSGVERVTREVVAADPARYGARIAPVPAATATPAPGPALPVPDDGSRQWSLDEVRAAPAAAVRAAGERGQLRALGWAPKRPGRR